MLSKQSIFNLRDANQAQLAKIFVKPNDAANAQIEQLQNDGSRSDTFKREEIARVREEARALMRPALAEMAERSRIAEEQEEFWNDREILLSRQRLVADPVVDELMRARLAAELAALPGPSIARRMHESISDRNLGMTWLTLRAGRAAGIELADWSHLELPDQAAVLQAVADTDAAYAAAEMIYGALSGLTIDAARKLTLARRMQPNAPTTHNSPGRPVAAR